jgi:hypothetical protein
MVLLNDEIVKKLHLLEKPVKDKVSKNITSSLSNNYILGGILGIILLLSYFIINRPINTKKINEERS